MVVLAGRGGTAAPAGWGLAHMGVMDIGRSVLCIGIDQYRRGHDRHQRRAKAASFEMGANAARLFSACRHRRL